ncbi:armadillo repeat-containing protein 7-like [Styela clava]
MFTTHKRLQQRTRPKKDLNRFDYLQALVTEFQQTKSESDKEQVLANLANFAYDPINYEYLRKLQVVDLFLDCLTDDEDINSKISEFGIAGLCNITADPKFRDYVLDGDDSVQLIMRCLYSVNTETVLSGMTTLMQLILPQSRNLIITPALVKNLKVFKESEDNRISNLATVFLEDYCVSENKGRKRSLNT